MENLFSTQIKPTQTSISVKVSLPTKIMITYNQTMEGINFIDTVRKKTISYSYVDLINEIKQQENPIPKSFQFDCITCPNRFFVKCIETGFFICDLVLNFYIFISINEIITKINTMCYEEKKKKKDKEIDKKIEKARIAFENIIYTINNGRDLFFNAVYAKKTGKCFNTLEMTRGRNCFNEFEVFDKWGFYSKHCIFDENELADEMEKKGKKFPKKFKCGLQY